jgi:hypothetical protein
VGKGVHKGVLQLKLYLDAASNKNSRLVYAMKCDVRKYFDGIDHAVLLDLIRRGLPNGDAMRFVREILESFHTTPGRGLPLGNVTSQLFANIYLHELDQFIVNDLKVPHYVRYCDDFVLLGETQNLLHQQYLIIQEFIFQKLKLLLHDDKMSIRKYSQGIDFLGHVVLPSHRQLRTKTKRRVFHKLQQRCREFNQGLISRFTLEQSFQSYLGVLSHANTYNVQRDLNSKFSIWLKASKSKYYNPKIDRKSTFD